MTRYSVHARQMLTGDTAYLIWDDAEDDVAGVRATREQAEAYAARLTRWQEARPGDDDSAPLLLEPGSFDRVMDAYSAIEPSEPRILEYERERLVLAQTLRVAA